jgi:hypothetical protein
MNNNFWDLYNQIGEIKVSKDRIIKISYVKKGNTEGIDIRNFYRDKNNLKEKIFLPTPKGIVIPKENLEEFINIINYKE